MGLSWISQGDLPREACYAAEFDAHGTPKALVEVQRARQEETFDISRVPECQLNGFAENTEISSMTG